MAGSLTGGSTTNWAASSDSGSGGAGGITTGGGACCTATGEPDVLETGRGGLGVGSRSGEICRLIASDNEPTNVTTPPASNATGAIRAGFLRTERAPDPGSAATKRPRRIEASAAPRANG